MKKFLKILGWTGIAIVALILAVIVFLGPIAKYVIQWKDEALTGRMITIDRLRINVFNGRVNVYDLKVYEKDNKTVFLGFRHLMVDLDEGKLLKSFYRLEHILLEDPAVRIVQKGSSFNFDDILKKFESGPEQPKDPADTVPTKYSLEDIRITGGTIGYNNRDYRLDAGVVKLGVGVPQISWNRPDLDVHYDFMLRSGGTFGGDLFLNLYSLAFTHGIKVDSLNLGVLYPYVTPFLKIRDLRGMLNLDIDTKGNFNDPQAIAIRGTSGIYNVSLTDEKGEKVAGFGSFTQTIDSLNLKQNIWSFGELLLDQPYFRYELFTETDNITQLVVPSAATDTTGGDTASANSGQTSGYNPFVMLASYISTLAKQIVITDYKVARFTIQGGVVDFYDHTLDQEFHLNLNELFFDVQQLNSNKNRALVDFHTSVNKGGYIGADIAVNPKDFMDFGLKYEMKNVSVTDYNPYSVYHVAYPFTKGKFNYTGTVTVRDHKMKMDNNLFVEKIYAGKKVRNQTAMNLPVKLVLAILRDKQGNITLNIPVEGDLDNPKFKVWKVVGQVLKNIFTKALAAPANLLAATTGANEEELSEIRFDYGQSQLTEKQMGQTGKVVKMLEEKPELVMELKQAVDPAKEMEYLAFFEAKKRYYYESQKRQPVPDPIPKEDLAAISAATVTDSAFLVYLNGKTPLRNSLASTLEKCTAFIGAGTLTSLQKSLTEQRNREFESFITTRLNLPKSRFTIETSTDPALLPEDGGPGYRISYSVPE